LRTYLDVIEGGENAGQALGERRWIKNEGQKCTPAPYRKSSSNPDGLSESDLSGWWDTHNIHPSAGGQGALERHECTIDNSKNILCPSWIYFNTTEGGGVGGGLLKATEKLLQKTDPINILNSMSMGTPPCEVKNYYVINAAGISTSERHFITSSDASLVNHCYDVSSSCDVSAMNDVGLWANPTYYWENGQKIVGSPPQEGFMDGSVKNAAIFPKNTNIVQKIYNVGITLSLIYVLSNPCLINKS
jgi:hypothetical protein